MKQLIQNSLRRLGYEIRPLPTDKTTAPLTLSDTELYLRNGRKPWSPGYAQFKHRFIQKIFANSELMTRFREGRELPQEFGSRLDERVVEYPWVVARLRTGEGQILDAGSTFNTPLILDLPQFNKRTLLIYTLITDWITLRPNVSYIFGDLCSTILKDCLFETIVCISTLEHIGMAQTMEYSMRNPYPDVQRERYQDALAEFRRLLIPGGQLLLTVPFGCYEDHGWLQQFDETGIEAIIQAFNGSLAAQAYYRYSADGWQVTSPSACQDCHYFNIHAAPEFDEDFAAAARAVACLELVRP